MLFLVIFSSIVFSIATTFEPASTGGACPNIYYRIDPNQCSAVLEEDEAWFLDSSVERNFGDFVDFAIAENNKTDITVTYAPEGCSKSLLAEVNDTVEIHFTGRAENGRVFETSRTVREGATEAYPFKVKLNGKMIVKGLEEGIFGMCEREKRYVIVPPHLGFERVILSLDFGGGDVPRGQTLYFDIEMIKIHKYNPDQDADEKTMNSDEFFTNLDLNKDNWLSKEEYLVFIIDSMKKDFVDTELTPQDHDELRKEGIKIVRDVFRHEDLNRDGSISKREYDLVRTSRIEEALLYKDRI